MNYIVVAALEDETVGLAQFAPLIHTGIGKLNAAIHLFDAIKKYQPDLIINYGTAGAVSDKSGLLKVTTFIQRDMDVRGLGFDRGVTPFAKESRLPKAQGVVLGTGDSFVNDAKKDLEGLAINIDLIDMEGFALHKVAEHCAIDFGCYKYVSDKADGNSSEDWAQNIAKGAVVFAELLFP